MLVYHSHSLELLDTSKLFVTVLMHILSGRSVINSY